MEKSQIIDKLFAVGAHFGYAPSRRHPSVSSYIFGAKGGAELIDLEKTAACLDAATAFVKTLAAERKIILFVGGKAEAREAVVRAAERIGQPYVASRWIGGSLTNFSEIKRRLGRLAEITTMREKGETAKFTKLERLHLDREAANLELMFGGLKGMNKLPDALIVVDPKRESGAIEEAHKLGIPTVAILNTDCDRRAVTYPIPANDASLQSITLILDELTQTYASNLAAAPRAAEAAAPIAATE